MKQQNRAGKVGESGVGKRNRCLVLKKVGIDGIDGIDGANGKNGEIREIREFRENALQIIVGSALTKLTKLLKLLKFSISAPSTISPIKRSVTQLLPSS
ncbi:MAG: hypothetical protein IKV04_04420 [Alistipes sp.]|nr:hypothetical protein [Alistipes sp.]